MQPTPTYCPIITTPPLDRSVEAYMEFCRAKAAVPNENAFSTDSIHINPICFRQQVLTIKWAIEGGCRAICKSFGLGKTIDQLEIVRILLEEHGGPGMIVTPLGVKQEFFRDAALLGTPVKFVKSQEEVEETGIHLTNYETVRDGKINLDGFTVLSLDEGSCLRSFGSKTFGEMLFGMAQNVPFRFVATATPSPNDYQEILAYAHFLGIMDIGQSRTRFFKRNSEKSDDLTLQPHKAEEFWLWVSSYMLFAEKPSDITGDIKDDVGYDMPELKLYWHEVKSPEREITNKKTKQNMMFADTSMGVSEASAEKRNSLESRTKKMVEILAENPDDHFILWHDLEDERKAIEELVPGVVTVYGSQDLDKKEKAIIDFSEGRIKYLGGKPVMLGSGTNLQRFCHKAIFLGIGFKFNDSPQHTYQILTKRPERMREYIKTPHRYAGIALVMGEIAHGMGKEIMERGLDISLQMKEGYIFPNIWLGVSVEDQKTADERISILLEMPSACPWISAEPLLSEIDLRYWLSNFFRDASSTPWINRTLKWVVVGGESGPGARPFNIEWARNIIHDCKGGQCPVFVKQLGSQPYRESNNGKPFIHLTDKKGGNIAEFPKDLQVREYPEVRV